MTPDEDSRVAKQLADLRLQVSAIEVATKASSLPDMLRQTRRTIWITGMLICASLVASAFIRICQNTSAPVLEDRIKALEVRVDALEARH